MMKMTKVTKAVAGAFLTTMLTVPVLDSAYAQSAYCDGIARDYANQVAPPGSGAVPGAVVGGVLGAIAGGVIGQGGKAVGAGAAIGAGVGGVSGASQRQRRWRQAYNAEYSRCARGTSHQPARHGAPPRWSDEWYAYCEAKYRSFNPATGKYRTYSGRYRYCQ